MRLKTAEDQMTIDSSKIQYYYKIYFLKNHIKTSCYISIDNYYLLVQPVCVDDLFDTLPIPISTHLQ